MSDQPARVCPFCRYLNAADERNCQRCGRRLPGPAVAGVFGFVRELLAKEAVVTQSLLGFCVLVSGLCVASDRRLPIWITDTFSSSTLLRFGALVGPLGSIEPFRYLAAVFVHVNVLHIGVNGWALTSIGPAAERQFGRARYVVLFMLAGILGFMVSDWWYGATGPLTVGASGAIFGLFGSVVGAAYARRDPAWKSHLISNVVNLAILGFAFPVNNAAHLGGLVVGAALGFAFQVERRQYRLGPVFGVLALLFLFLAPLSVLLSNASPIWRAQQAREAASSE